MSHTVHLSSYPYRAALYYSAQPGAEGALIKEAVGRSPDEALRRLMLDSGLDEIVMVRNEPHTKKENP